jgi:DNA invertase Pin-like site-specific DNA recombinase
MITQTMGLAGATTSTNQPLLEKVRYVLYARKSSESDELQALSIDSQVKEMLQIAEREGLEIVDIRREAHSAKDSGQRPVFAELLADLRRGRFNGILTWAPDRLSRNAGDLGSLVDLMDQKILIDIRTYGQRFSNSPNEKFLLMILCSQAKLENDNKSVNVKRGLRTRVEMGLWPGQAPTGYLNENRSDRKGQVMVDKERAPVIKQIFEKVAYENWTGRKLYHWLRFELNFRTKSNHHLSLANVYLILDNHFYYGTFEYPKKSGNWYEGKHKPIINKELFMKAQAQIKRDQIVRSETREFAFTKLIACGKCGSGITAEEKYKKLKDGTTSRYVYYGCSRSKDHHCKSQYVREESLIEQLAALIDQVDLDELGVKHKLEAEIERHHQFQRNVMGTPEAKGEDAKTKDVNLRNYIKYLLKEGSLIEKREMMACFKTKLAMMDKVVQLAT